MSQARRTVLTMVVPSGDADGYKLAYEEGKKAVADQGDTLKDTRDRAGTLGSAAARAQVKRELPMDLG